MKLVVYTIRRYLSVGRELQSVVFQFHVNRCNSLECLVLKIQFWWLEGVMFFVRAPTIVFGMEEELWCAHAGVPHRENAGAACGAAANGKGPGGTWSLTC